MLTGKNLVAGEWRDGKSSFQAVQADNGQSIDPAFAEASRDDVSDACRAAADAQTTFGSLDPASRAKFLRLAADKIDALGDTLTQRAMAESGLPEARLNGERGRTVGQLRLFADEVENGGWQGLRIDHAGRTPRSRNAARTPSRGMPRTVNWSPTMRSNSCTPIPSILKAPAQWPIAGHSASR